MVGVRVTHRVRPAFHTRRRREPQRHGVMGAGNDNNVKERSGVRRGGVSIMRGGGHGNTREL